MLTQSKSSALKGKRKGQKSRDFCPLFFGRNLNKV
jgi:hypothetical protein